MPSSTVYKYVGRHVQEKKEKEPLFQLFGGFPSIFSLCGLYLCLNFPSPVNSERLLVVSVLRMSLQSFSYGLSFTIIVTFLWYTVNVQYMT